MNSSTCSRCGLRLLPDEERMVPSFVAVPAVVGFAFLHAGMWAKEALSKPFCARCARLVITAAAVAGAVILTFAALGMTLWLRGPWR